MIIREIELHGGTKESDVNRINPNGFDHLRGSSEQDKTKTRTAGGGNIRAWINRGGLVPAKVDPKSTGLGWLSWKEFNESIATSLNSTIQTRKTQRNFSVFVIAYTPKTYATTSSTSFFERVACTRKTLDAGC